MTLKREIKGKVVKKSGDKSITLLVERKVVHPRYHKIVKRFKKYIVHDESNEANVGDTLVAVECRPISRKKSFKIKEITERGVGA